MPSVQLFVKTTFIKSAIDSELFKSLSSNRISIESAQSMGFSSVVDQKSLISLGELVTALDSLKSRNLDLIDSVMVTADQLEYLEVMCLA